jgi:hypothetical protein
MKQPTTQPAPKPKAKKKPAPKKKPPPPPAAPKHKAGAAPLVPAQPGFFHVEPDLDLEGKLVGLYESPILAWEMDGGVPVPVSLDGTTETGIVKEPSGRYVIPGDQCFPSASEVLEHLQKKMSPEQSVPEGEPTSS